MTSLDQQKIAAINQNLEKRTVTFPDGTMTHIKMNKVNERISDR